jgi:hypothetical protein
MEPGVANTGGGGGGAGNRDRKQVLAAQAAQES